MIFQTQRASKVSAAALLLLATALLGVAACSPASTTASVALTPVRFQMGWFHDYSASPFQQAETNGHFTANGLDATVKPGGFDSEGNFISPLNVLLSGEADFATISSSTLLVERAKGTPLVAIASIAQRSPVSLISLAETGIVTPADLVGKTVAVTDDVARYTLETLLNAQEIQVENVNIVPRPGFGIDPLLNGDVDALSGWILNEGLLVTEAGREPNILLYSDYGINSYSFLIVTTEDMIEKQPAAVQGMVQALIDGTQDVVNDLEKAAEVTVQYNSELDKDAQLARLQIFLPLINPPGEVLGNIDRDVLELEHQLLLDNGLLTEPVELDAAYTLEFINKVHQDA
jgi:NitT/TauT family transport system substrate-binding protein